MNTNSIIFGALSFIWILGGTWWLSSSFTGSDTTTDPGSHFILADGEFTTQANSNFLFEKSTADVEFEEDLGEALKEAVAYLINHPDKRLIISGLYGSNEMNKTEAPNLGIARAMAVKKVLADMRADESQIITNGTQVDNLIIVDDKVQQALLFQFKEVDQLGMTTTTDQAPSTKINAAPSTSPLEQRFTFDYEENDFQFEIGDEMSTILDQWKAYVDENPTAKVVVAAYAKDGIDKKAASRITDKLAARNRRVLREYGFTTPQVVPVSHGNDDYEKGAILEIYLDK